MIVKKDPSSFQAYLEDSSNLEKAHADKVLIPENVSEISSVLKEANFAKTPVTVSGAGTGQAGGRIPFGGIVLSMEKLNSIKEIKREEKGGYAVAGAGVTISELKKACDRKTLFYTYDPTEQTAFFGGTIATNASGASSFKYGATRKSVRALKLVLADGSFFSLKRGDFKAKKRILDFENGQKQYKVKLPTYDMPRTKNSAGYYAKDNMDLIDLFVGEEGTLAVIAEADVALVDKPKGFFSSFVFFKDAPSAWNFAESAPREGAPLSIEYFDSRCLDLLREKYGNVPGFAKTAIFFEDEITESEDAVIEKWEKYLSGHKIPLDDTWVAIPEKARLEFLDKRHYVPERMSEMAKRSGFPKVSTDLAVPKNRLRELLCFYEENLKNSNLKYFVFGHIGDAHLHVNMIAPDEKGYAEAKRIQLEFVKKSVTLGGTVSAEHGIGKTKREFLKILYGEKGIREMLEVKRALDPNLILGKGNIFES